MNATISVPLEDIGAGARMRRLREATIVELAESIRESGLLHPIAVTPDGKGFQLVAGAHRLEAFRRLRVHDRISALLLDIHNADSAALAEIDENLIRADLSAAETAAHHAKRKEIYERLHPETKHGGDRKSVQYTRSSGQIGHLKTYATDAAAKTATAAATSGVKRNAARSRTSSNWPAHRWILAKNSMRCRGFRRGTAHARCAGEGRGKGQRQDACQASDTRSARARACRQNPRAAGQALWRDISRSGMALGTVVAADGPQPFGRQPLSDIMPGGHQEPRRVIDQRPRLRAVSVGDRADEPACVGGHGGMGLRLCVAICLGQR